MRTKKKPELRRISAGPTFQTIPGPAPVITIKLGQVKNTDDKMQQH